MSKIIGTHSGQFHCDESLACFMLHQTQQFKDAKIIRSRDPKVLATADILVDVGAVYDPEKNLLDHHQRGFVETMNANYSIKLSSAGLVYKHFGKEVLANLLNERDEKIIEVLYWKVYDNFVLPIDAIDNGVTQGDNLRYHSRTDLSSRVSYLNPNWNEPEHDLDSRFMQAVELTGREFVQACEHYYKSWLPARKIVEESIHKRHDLDSSGRIIELTTACPWAQHLFDLEKELNIEGQTIYVIFNSEDSWRVRAVPINPDSFENRKPLPEPWRGKRDEELSAAADIPGCVFVHASGFIGGTKTKDAALDMARKALIL